MYLLISDLKFVAENIFFSRSVAGEGQFEMEKRNVGKEEFPSQVRTGSAKLIKASGKKA